MEGKKTFIGFDLGDGESITDYVTMDAEKINERGIQIKFTDMTMPGSNDPGKAIPTVFAYDRNGELLFGSSIIDMPEEVTDVKINFKRRPSDLIPDLSEKRKAELLNLFINAKSWPGECRDCDTPQMKEFRESVVSFTNGVFEKPMYLEKVKSEAADSEEIVFSVGHPTRWDELDVAIYKQILQSSVLGKGTYAGKKSSLVMAAESRAAYLAVSKKAAKDVLPRGSSALLIDVGSSTIDLTAVTADAHNYQYNSGSNYLGVRGIDYLISELCMEKLKETGSFADYQKLLAKNPALGQAWILECRMAKERVYSGNGRSRVTLGFFQPIPLGQEEVDQLIESKPIAPLLARNINLSEEQIKKMGNKSWAVLFQEFLESQKAQIAKNNIRIGRIILTGSASKMPVVSKIVRKVFKELPNGGILSDMDPSRSISTGLALVGPSNEKSKAFQQDLLKLLDEKLPTIIEQDLPELGEKLSGIIANMVEGIVKSRLHQWRNREITTLNRMTEYIKEDCNSKNLEQKLKNNQQYKDAVQKWMTDNVGKDIALELRDICKKYNVKGLSLDDLNIMKVPDVNIGSIKIDPLDFMNVIIAIVSVVAGIVAAIALPFVMGIVIGLISWISTGIAALLLEICLAIPGAGWAVLLAVAGMAAIMAAVKGLGGAKEELLGKIQGMDLPQWLRNRMTDEKISKEISKANIKQKVKGAFTDEETKKEITQSVAASLRGQVEKRAEDIKYVIESM